MSRTYRISIPVKVSQQLRRHIQVEDGICTHLELLKILPPERTEELLREELTARGFEDEGDTLSKKTENGVEISIDPASGAVNVRMQLEKDLQLQRDLRTRVSEDSKAAGERRLRQQAKVMLESDAHAATETLSENATRQLEKALGDVRQQLDEISHRVTARALEERASQLGEIQEITEEPESGAITIRVRV